MLATIPDWWARRAAAAGLSEPWRDWRRALPPPPLPLSDAPLDHLCDSRSTQIGEAYVDALDPHTRLLGGRHYTPAALAERLWEEIESAGVLAGPIFDPACGAGALLLPPLRRAVAEAEDAAAALAAIPDSIGGVDVDVVAVWLGNALLAAEFLPLWARLPGTQRAQLPELLRVGDGLARDRTPAQVVVMNPPYGRVRLDPHERSHWQETLYGHANRYALFVHAAIKSVAADGLVAAVIPTSFLGGAYYQRLRAFIAEQAPLTRLTFVDARSGVFSGDVLQETCLAVFRRASKPGLVACARATVNGSVDVIQLPAAPAPAEGALPWLLPRRPGDGQLVAAAARLRARLTDYGWRASTGPLVWNRHKSQISAAPAPGRTPILWGADIDDGEVRRNPTRDSQRWIALRRRDEFMRLSEPAVLVQRTTAPEQPRRLRAARLDIEAITSWGGAVVVENHVNVLRCSDPQSPLTPDLLEQLLHTTTFDRLYRCLTGTVAVSAYELEAMPLPPAAVLREWQKLDGHDLGTAVASYYDDATA